MTSGIYEILNTVNGKRYIGSASDFMARWKTHRHQLRRGFHHSVLLQRAWNKYGESSFKFLPILTCQPSQLLFYEQQLLDKAKPEYNIAKEAGAPMAGRKHTSDTKARITASNRGRRFPKRSPMSAETRARIGAAALGKRHSPERTAKIAAANRGKMRSPETRALLSARAMGRVVSLETRAKMSASHIKRHLLKEHQV